MSDTTSDAQTFAAGYKNKKSINIGTMEVAHHHTRLCLTCKKPVKGRADKKFCNDYCRNIYNNKQQSETNSYMRALNRYLNKNRSILAELLGDEKMVKHPKNSFIDKGFRFKYHTHQYKNQKGDVYYFCYEYGYLPLDNEWYLIVKKKEAL